MKFLKDTTYAKIISILLFIMFAVLFVVGIAYTGINLSIYDEQVGLYPNNPLYIFVVLLLGFLSFIGLGKFYDKFLSKTDARIVTGITCILMYIISVIWIICAQNLPQADAKFVIEFAERINAGVQEPFLEDTYITFFPYQLGFVTVVRFLGKIFGDGNYRIFAIVLALDVVLTTASGSGIIKHIVSEDRSSKVRFFYCVLMFLCLPLYFYTPMIYGDLPYAALSLFAIYLMFECISRPRIYKFILVFIVCGLNYLIKSYAIITVVAMLIYLVVCLFDKDKRRSSLILMALIIAGTLIFTKLNYRIYRDYMQGGFDSVPFVASVAMGFNDDNGNAGWCNFYHQIKFVECEYDAKLTSEVAKADIRGVLVYMAKHPLYTLDFYYRKINYQWNTPMYQSLNMICSHEAEGQPAFGKLMFESEKAWWNLAWITKIFQLLIYGSIFGKLLISIRRKQEESLKIYVPMIAVFGNYLFSMIWEAKTRYVFPAYLMLMPFGAFCLFELIDDYKGLIFNKIRDYLSEVSVQKEKYPGIDLIKIIMAIAVVAIHTIPHVFLIEKYGSFKPVDGFINSAVGFFFLAAGFLLGRKLLTLNTYEEKKEAITGYIKKLLKLYMIWTIVYLPLAVYNYINNHYRLPVAIWDYIQGLIFTGEHFNSWILWYLLSSIVACFFVILMLKINVKESVWIVCCVLIFLIGYYLDYLAEGNIGGPIADGIRIFLRYTFGNGRILRGVAILPFGVYLSKRKGSIKSGIVLLLIGYLFSLLGRFGDVPMFFESLGLLFIGANIKLPDSKIWPVLRRLSTHIYFLHLWVWTAVYMLLYNGKTFGPIPFICTVSVSVVLGLAIIFVSDRIKLGKAG